MKTIVLLISIILIVLYTIQDNKETSSLFVNNDNLSLFSNSKRRSTEKYLDVSIIVAGVLLMILSIL